MAVVLCIIVRQKDSWQSAETSSEQCPFTTDVLLPVLPVANQGHTPLCWVYAMLRTIETDRLAQGDSVRLSPTYLVRQMLVEQADLQYLTRRSPSCQGISARGVATDCLALMQRYGAVPLESYPSHEIDYQALCQRIEHISRLSVSLREMRRSLDDVLDDRLGALPKAVFMLGARYTMMEFAHSVALPNSYRAYVSALHHPFGEQFSLESADNHYDIDATNLPIDSLMTLIEASLRHGHAVCWEGDISENMFQAEHGTAMMQLQSHQYPVQQWRQRQIETFQTTDDHCLTLLGMAHDKSGNRYFIAQNSWGDVGPYHGLIYLSADYLRMKTLMIVSSYQSQS